MYVPLRLFERKHPDLQCTITWQRMNPHVVVSYALSGLQQEYGSRKEKTGELGNEEQATKRPSLCFAPVSQQNKRLHSAPQTTIRMFSMALTYIHKSSSSWFLLLLATLLRQHDNVTTPLSELTHGLSKKQTRSERIDPCQTALCPLSSKTASKNPPRAWHEIGY